MRFRLGIHSKSKKVLVTSLEEQKNFDGEFDPKIKARISGSKEEIFFDSQAWLDSDCEDDYFSVNGDFTPSRGSTPNHKANSNRTSHWDKHFSPVTLADSEFDGKKRLFDLLQENESEESANKQQMANGKADSNTEMKNYRVNDTEHRKLPSSEGTPNKDLKGTPSRDLKGTPSRDLKGTPSRNLKDYKERMSKTSQCCLPSLMHSLSFKERRKHKMSPVH